MRNIIEFCVIIFCRAIVNYSKRYLFIHRIKQTYKTQSRVIKTLNDVLELDEDDCPGCFTDENSKSCFKINNKYLMNLKNSHP